MKYLCGVKAISTLNISLIICICLTSFTVSFNSLSVIFQLYAASHSIQINILRLIIYKFINGIISALISYSLISITPFYKYINVDKNVFSNHNLHSSFNNYLLNHISINTFFISTTCVFIFILFILCIKKVAKK